MKRSTKNIICLILIFILIFLIGGTIYIAKNNLSNNEIIINNDNIPDNTNNQMPIDGQNMNDGETPPEIPNEENSNGQMQKPDMDSNTDMTTPPEKPDEESSGNEILEKPDGESSGNEIPEKPDGESATQKMSDIQNNTMQMPNFNNNVSLTMPYYIAIAIETLLLSLIIIYLIQSKFNSKSIKETYYTKDKIIIIVLMSIICASVFTLGISYLTNAFILNTNTKVENSKEMNTNTNITYSSKKEITESTTISNESYNSDSSDENALSVSGDIEVTLDEITVSKTGDSDGGDNTSFYGTNSAVIVKDGATLTLNNAVITTDATGANGVFSYGGSATTNNSSTDGTTLNISNSTITTTKDNSGGIMTTGGGVTNATNLIVNTSGTSSAAIRSDRGGGSVNVDGGTYITTGKGSPSIYSTADITVKNAELISTTSEGIVIEGKNSVTLENVTLTDTNNTLNGQSTTYKNIFLYQSMSGDADSGVSEFYAKDSTITTNVGDTLYITNTTAKISLSNNTIINNDSTANFLRASADSWGSSENNGGLVTLIMNNQTVSGNIYIDSISTLDMTLKSSSVYTGAINNSNSAKSIELTLDKTSKIILTDDSYITSINNADTTNSNIIFNGYKLYVNGEAIN